MPKLFQIVLGLIVAGSLQAQEGFPLDGTWRAQHVVNGEPLTVVLIMQWDGKSLSGTINPGPDGIDFTDAKLEPAGWKLTIDAKDAKGQSIKFEGVLSEIGSYNRVLAGQWVESGKTEALRFVRE